MPYVDAGMSLMVGLPTQPAALRAVTGGRVQAFPGGPGRAAQPLLCAGCAAGYFRAWIDGNR